MSTCEIEPLTYSVQEAAAVIGVSPATIRNMIREGDIPSARVRARVLIRREEIEKLLK